MCVAVGVLLTILVVWVALASMTLPECTTDPDNTAARLVVQVGDGIIAAVAVALPVAVVVIRRRLTGGWRTIIVLGFPIAVVGMWVVLAATMAGVLHSIEPNASAACM